MNDIAMPWKRIYATYPELDNVPESRGWTREEIGRMLRNTHDPMERALVLVLASSGVRSGGLDHGARVIFRIFVKCLQWHALWCKINP